MLKTIYLTFCLLLFSTSIFANDSFILSSIEETQKLSKLTNKPALIIFGADYCKFCNSLKEDILNKKLNPTIDTYIICYIDIKLNPELKDQYSVNMIPDSRIFSNTKEIRRIKGYSKNNYLKWLNND